MHKIFSYVVAKDTGEGSAQNRANLYAKPFASHETAVELVLAVEADLRCSTGTRSEGRQPWRRGIRRSGVAQEGSPTTMSGLTSYRWPSKPKVRADRVVKTGLANPLLRDVTHRHWVKGILPALLRERGL